MYRQHPAKVQPLKACHALGTEALSLAHIFKKEHVSVFAENTSRARSASAADSTAERKHQTSSLNQQDGTVLDAATAISRKDCTQGITAQTLSDIVQIGLQCS